jgi:glucose/arabinose dehydrogenase
MSMRHRLDGTRRYGIRLLLGVVGATLLVPACSDDDDDGPGGGGSGGRAGSPNLAGAPPAGGAGAGGPSAEGGAAGAEAGSGGASGGSDPSAGSAGEAGASQGGQGGSDRNAFRPEELPFDAEAFAALKLPEGFAINVYRTGLGQARMLAVHGEHVYVTQPMQGNVLRLVDADEDGVAEAQAVVASDLPMVHGIAFHEDEVFLANVHSVYHGTVEADGSFGTLTEIISDLPDGGQHALRTLGVGPDDLLYISVGSDCDACPETNPEHATLLRSTLAGQAAGARTIFASGLRNTIGFGWHPVSDALWGMDHGSDWRGDDLPPEELNAIEAGKDYGWPYCYGDREPDPIIQDPPDSTKAAYCAGTEPPVLVHQAHQAPIGMTFYTGATFPERYTNGAFVAFHGSWNRKPATGYRVGFVAFEEGQPQAIEDFVDGFLIQDGAATFGRPAGIAVAPDGALLFTDDTNGIVYRVQYE